MLAFLLALQDPQVAVIIPFFNEQDNLRNAIKSAQLQTVKELEILCVDDGSTDRSVEVVLGLQEDDPRIRLISLDQNMGLVYGRVAGVRAAKAPYVAFLDADDAFYDDAILDLALQEAEKHNADVVHFKEFRFFMKQGRWNTEVYDWANPVNYGPTTGARQIQDSYLHGANGSTMHGKLIRTQTYKEAIALVGEDIISAHIFYNEDMLMMGAIYLCTNVYVGMNKTGYSYYYHASNSMTQSRNSLEAALRR